MKSKYIDLHVHTNFSDGFDSIEEVIRKARENNVHFLSLTEHYNLSSYEIAKKIAGDDIEIIPGLEVGTDMSKYNGDKTRKEKHVCHLLAYFVDKNICELLDMYEIGRYECVKDTIALLNKKGIDITINNVLEYARDKKSVGRFDIAIALSKMGFSKSPHEAYGKYLDHNGMGYVKRQKLDPFELTKKIVEYGGVPVLAHPKSLRMAPEEVERFIRKLKKCGLCGIEVYNPNNNEEYRNFYLGLCQKYNLVATVGSDYHGGNRKPVIEVGKGINSNLLISDTNIITGLKKKKKSIDKTNSKR